MSGLPHDSGFDSDAQDLIADWRRTDRSASFDEVRPVLCRGVRERDQSAPAKTGRRS